MALISCPECGTQVSEYAQQCIKCAFPVAQKTNIISGNVDENEKTYREGAGAYLKSTFNVIQGTFVLTSKKFMFCKRSGLFNAVAGPLLMHLAKGSHLVFEIELSNLKSITYKKHGLGKQLYFTNRFDEGFLIIFTSAKEKWIEAILYAVKNNYPSIGIKQIGDDYLFSI